MSRRVVVYGVVLFLVVAVGVASYYPLIDDLFVGNPYWNGLSEFYARVEPVRIHDTSRLDDVDPLNSTVFIIGPTRVFSEEDVETISEYLESGGKLVLMDDFGSGNSLLEGLGLETRFSGELLRDPVFYDPEPVFPRLLNFSSVDGGDVVLNYATTLVDGEELVVAESSSPLSYVNSSGGLVNGSFHVMGRIIVGSGSVCLVADSSIFMNSMIGTQDNFALTEVVIQGIPYIDSSYSIPTRLLSVKWLINDIQLMVGRPEVLYLLVIGVSYLISRVKLSEDELVQVGEVEKVLSRFPEWDRERLGCLVEQRRRIVGSQ